MSASLPRPPAEPYDPGRDYTDYKVTDRDQPFMTTSAAGDMLGVQPETVRQYVRCGKLPGVRPQASPDSKRSPAVLVPRWAVVGRCQLRASRSNSETPREEEYRLRSQALESAIAVLRDAEEHARMARDLSRQAETEWEAAVTALSDAVAQVVAPQTPQKAAR